MIVYCSKYDGSTWGRRAPKAPLCKGSCREATEGLCGEMFPIRQTFGEYVTSYCGNPSATSVRTGGTSLCTREALGAVSTSTSNEEKRFFRFLTLYGNP